MSNPGPSGAVNRTPGPPRQGNPQGNKRKYFYSPFGNRQKSEYYDKPYLLYITAPPSSQDPFQCLVNKDKLTEKLPNGWKLYFHDDDVVVLKPDIIANQVARFGNYLKACGSRINYQEVKRTRAFEVDIDDLAEKHWPSFFEDLKARPEHTLSCLALSMHLQLNRSNVTTLQRHLVLLTPRLTNIEMPICSVRSLTMADCGKLIRIRGNITQASEGSIEWVWRTFQCGTCELKQVVLQRDGKMILPNYCKGCSKRGKDYSVDSTGYFNIAAESQTLRLQETRSLAAGASYRKSDVPVNIDLLMQSDLVNKISPGTDVLCTGILKSRVEGELDRRYYLYLEVIAVQAHEDVDERNFDYSENDYLVVERMKMEPNPFRLLVHSLCPKIIGQEMVKASMLLGMFSVSPKDYRGRRREVHLLVVGDPGLGKSEILEACSVISPSGVFVSSNSCTNSGLTATMSNDSAQKSMIEAGALVMADQGVCCIDELDKITTKMDVLLEAMEDQVVNIAKAGVITKLRSKTSVLAAANPIGGHYNKTKRVTDNLKIALPVLSRFDLVLVLIDQKKSDVDGRFINNNWSKDVNKTSKDSSDNLQMRLKFGDSFDESFEPLSESSFQKLLSFVNRKYVPEMSEEAKLVIKDYFITLRHRPFFSDIIPVTTRTLLSLIRMTQARAKIDFARHATKEHAQDVVELHEFGLRDVRDITEEDIVHQHNMQSKEHKQSKAKQLSSFTRMLQIRAKGARLTMLTKDDLKELGHRAGVRNVNEIIELLNANGVLLRKDPETFQFVDL